MKSTIRSPIPYMGNKYKLLPQLLELFPKKCDIFVDLFGGSGVVSLNYQGSIKTIYNEINQNIVNLIKMIVQNNPDELDKYFKEKIKFYNLREKSQKTTYKDNSDGYYSMRSDYNNSKDRDYKDLFLLICYSINHLIRFNKKSEFNASNGSDSYNEKNLKAIQDMHKIFENITIMNEDAFDLTWETDGLDLFVYCDVPYLNTEAVYNEKRAFGGWNMESDLRLFEMLENFNKKGIKWGLSNVFFNRGKENTHLIEWCEKCGWKVFHLNRNYNPFSRGNSNNDEVYICNYLI